MRPAIVAWLTHAGWPGLASLVPAPGFFYVMIVFAAGALFCWRARAVGLSLQRATTFVLVGGLAGVVGSHLFNLLVTGGWRHIPVSRWLVDGGTASWGAYLGVATAVTVYGAMTRMNPWQWLDLVVSVHPLGEIIGRAGACFLAGDDFGRVTNVPWAIQFPAHSLAWQAHMGRGLLGATAEWSLPIHPLQLYLAGNALLLLVIVTVIWRRFRERPGMTLGWYLILYGCSRFFWEFLRDPAAGGSDVGLSTAQWMCILFVVAGSTVLMLLQRRSNASARPQAG